MTRGGWILVSVLALGGGGALGYCATQDAFEAPPRASPPREPVEARVEAECTAFFDGLADHLIEPSKR